MREPAQILPRVLFVCLGNICRSPLAEAAFRAEAAAAGLDAQADSAGTAGYHVGSPPDRRAIAEAARHGIDIAHYRGRQVTAGDFRAFTHVFALDADNLASLRRVRPADGTAALSLLMDVVPGRQGRPVADPYYGDAADFAKTWAEVHEASRALVTRLTETTLSSR
ncbi:MAG TPA: low molecular weight protein-tyrosine-phosphatase [Croceicoccus sp.]|nr:low molecular weight protein-tyrosine-phosphatase [Croceicoccus sp.]